MGQIQPQKKRPTRMPMPSTMARGIQGNSCIVSELRIMPTGQPSQPNMQASQFITGRHQRERAAEWMKLALSAPKERNWTIRRAKESGFGIMVRPLS